MRRLPATLLTLFSLGSQAQTTTITVEVDSAQVGSAVRDVFGANRHPSATSKTPGTSWDGSMLYTTFGVTQVRTHDTGVDLCETYTVATKTNAGVNPSQPVTGCTLSGIDSFPHFTWTPASTADADLNNPDHYDFTAVDEAIKLSLATGAAIYLRLGESYNGPNDTNDPVAWAKVATNVYRHVIGAFKPSTGVAVDPAFIEIHNEPDGGFWVGSTATFNTLFTETAQRVRAAAAAAGKTVKVGGAGFTNGILTSAKRPGNPANGFVSAVGASNLDFFSAHHYSSCGTATLSNSATFLRSLRALVDQQGGGGKPIHITEWNIGLGQQCGEAFYSEQRTQSFASAFLTMLQDPAQNIEAAHFYAAMPIMSLFNFTSVAGKVGINPSAWAFWAHTQLKGNAMVRTSVCPSGGACVDGYAAESTSLMALSGQSGTTQTVVLTNDNSASVAYTLRVKGLSSASVTATIRTPPSGRRDLATVGNPAKPDSAALASLLASVTTETRSDLAVQNGTVELTLDIPAQSVQVLTFTPSASSNVASDCLFNWAEHSFPQYFAPAGATSATATPYYFRYYSTTQSYLATSSADGNVWVLGGAFGNEPRSVGPTSTILSTAGCAR